MQFITLLLPLLSLAAAAPGYPAAAPNQSAPCPTAGTVTVTATTSTYTSTTTMTNTVGATATVTETDTIIQTATSVVPTITSVLGTSLVTSCAAPITVTKRAKRAWETWNPQSYPQCPTDSPTDATVTTTTTVSLVSIATTTITTTGTATVTRFTTSTTTSTSTSTQTTTTSTTTIVAIPTFVVYVQGGNNDGLYFSIEDDIPARIVDYQDLANSASFTILPDGSFAVAVAPNPVDVGKIAMSDSDFNSGDPDLVYAEGPSDVLNNGPNAQSITCAIGLNPDGTCPLNCATLAGETVSYDCGAYWRLASATNFGCPEFKPFVVGSA